jgi:hypothetical protein
MNNNKSCTRCQQTKPIDAFGFNRSAKDGRQHWCKECLKAYWHEKAREIGRRTYTKDWQRRAYRKNPSLQAARRIALRALRRDELKQPIMCEACGDQPWAEMHHDDYSKPLEVKFFCNSCHKLVHYAEDDAS